MQLLTPATARPPAILKLDEEGHSLVIFFSHDISPFLKQEREAQLLSFEDWLEQLMEILTAECQAYFVW